MARKVADVMWELLAKAGVKRCYGIVGDALNPVIDALRRNGKIEFIHVRHEEYGVFAAVAEAYLTGDPVAVCGTAGPGVTHLFNGLMDARKEGAAIIAIAGDVETKLMDTAALEELNPYKFFDTACLYVGRVVNPEQSRAVFTTAILTAVVDKGPTVISMPGDIASASAPDDFAHEVTIPAVPVFRPAGADINKLAGMIEAAKKRVGFTWLRRCSRSMVYAGTYLGNLGFLVAHLVLILVWSLANLHVVPGLKAFDPFPFGVLALVVSSESVFLTIFVLISQNRMARQSERRSHLDLQVGMLSEQELTTILKMLQKLCLHMGVNVDSSRKEVQSFSKTTDVHKLASELEDKLPGE